jgi:hypothetical protein
MALSARRSSSTPWHPTWSPNTTSQPVPTSCPARTVRAVSTSPSTGTLSKSRSPVAPWTFTRAKNAVGTQSRVSPLATSTAAGLLLGIRGLGSLFSSSVLTYKTFARIIRSSWGRVRCESFLGGMCRVSGCFQALLGKCLLRRNGFRSSHMPSWDLHLQS